MKKIVTFLFLVVLVQISLLLSKLYLQPIAVVDPHHNVVADKRIDALETIKENRLITNRIIVLSPNHFSKDQRSIYYSNINWEFKDSTLEFDKNYYLDLSFKLDNDLVKNDHGIFNILADVGILWPNIKVMPILIGQQVKFEDLDVLIDNLNLNCGYNCLLIASVDFSHYLPYKLANIHDQESIQALINMDLSDEKQIEVDSPQSVFSLINFSQNKKASKFVLFSHTNSAELVKAEDSESTSHIIGWYQRNLFSKPKKYEVKTFVLANDLSKRESLNSLGERFFYGVDEINLNNSEIAKDLVVACYENEKEIKKIYLPLICKEKVCIFARGEEKKKLLQKILLGIDNTNGETTTIKN